MDAEFFLPGDFVDLEAITDSRERNKLLDDLEGMGYQLNSRGVLGLIETCEDCDGEGKHVGVKGDRNCRKCDGSGTTIDEGRGKKPFWD